ncbi:unnamed protein product [Prorocentrum cordatum]|uniref:Ankyrin repeat domain-containing protein n=1 Tax=Prorocentrum cordatum TaxID=2364126 RepID=A0ABN9S799_9DINO|nr:unnamed protein product [Polarella glacialis]
MPDLTPAPSTAVARAAAAGDAAALERALEAAPAEESSVSGSAAVDVNARGYLEATAVSRAARQGHVSVLECLLQAGADPDIPNMKSQYPLHFAAFNLRLAAVGVLLRHGASTFVLDRKGRTPAEDTSSEQIRDAILAARVGAA